MLQTPFQAYTSVSEEKKLNKAQNVEANQLLFDTLNNLQPHI